MRKKKSQTEQVINTGKDHDKLQWGKKIKDLALVNSHLQYSSTQRTYEK